MKRVKLVLRGGGTRYPVYAGAFKVLSESDFLVEEVLGTSAGAIAAGILASGRTPEHVHDLMRKALPSKLLDARWFPPPVWPFVDGTKGVYKGNTLLDFARENLPSDYDHTALPVHISTHNWTRGENRVWTKGDLPLHVRASMSLPIFDMVTIAGDLYEDGGVSGNFLLDYDSWRIRSQAPVIGLSLLSPDDTRPRSKPKNKAERLSGSISDLIEANDREHIEDAKHARVVYLRTEHRGLELGMTEEDVDDMVEEGAAAMRIGLSKIEKVLR